MQLPALIQYPDGTRVLFHSPAAFTAPLLVTYQRPVNGGVTADDNDPDAPVELEEVTEEQTVTHGPEVWMLWSPADWAAMCPDLIVRPVVDPGAPEVAGKRAVRQPVEAWGIGDDVATVTYATVDLTPAEIAAAEAAKRRAERDAAMPEALNILSRHRNQKDYGIPTTLTDEHAVAWAVYLQGLRDYPETGVWPDKPE